MYGSVDNLTIAILPLSRWIWGSNLSVGKFEFEFKIVSNHYEIVIVGLSLFPTKRKVAFIPEVYEMRIKKICSVGNR